MENPRNAAHDPAQVVGRCGVYLQGSRLTRVVLANMLWYVHEYDVGANVDSSIQSHIEDPSISKNADSGLRHE